MGTALTPYYGEFLVSPMPLELSLVEPCEYACSYCFAVLNDRYWASKKGESVHRSQVKSVLTLLRDFTDRNTLEASLLRHGAPILMSNRTDPFSRVNRSASLPMINVLTELGFQIAFQTKGFINPEDFDVVMDLLPIPTCWYISIASLSEDYRSKIEPGAPTIAHRLELIEKLRDRGHSVTVGINPCVPEWVGDPEKLIKELSDRDVWGVWIESLHLSKDQRAQLTDRERANLGEEIIARAAKRTIDPYDAEFSDRVRDAALATGLQVYSIGYDKRSDFFKPYHLNYSKTFPTIQDFLNACWDEFDDGDLVEFSAFAEFMLPHLPEGIHSAGHYVGATSRSFVKSFSGKWTNYLPYEQVLKWIWSEKTVKGCIADYPNFSYATAKEGNEVVRLVDESGLPIVLFHRSGWKDFWVDVENWEKSVNQ